MLNLINTLEINVYNIHLFSLPGIGVLKMLHSLCQLYCIFLCNFFQGDSSQNYIKTCSPDDVKCFTTDNKRDYNLFYILTTCCKYFLILVFILLILQTLEI